jgi:hypothetical protein
MGRLHDYGYGILCCENYSSRRCWYEKVFLSPQKKIFDENVLIFFSFPFLIGFGLGAFISLMSASFAYEDPYLRAQTQVGLNTAQKASQIFKEMGKGMWSSGKSFGKIGALFAGIECVIEGVRCLFARLLAFSLLY